MEIILRVPCQVFKLELDGELPEPETGFTGNWWIERAWPITPGHYMEGDELRFPSTLDWLKRDFGDRIEAEIQKQRQLATDEAAVDRYEEDRLFAG